jgi:hypothetical protein
LVPDIDAGVVDTAHRSDEEMVDPATIARSPTLSEPDLAPLGAL